MVDDDSVTYTVTVGQGEEPTLVRSPRLDPAVHGGDAVEVIGVELDETGWVPTAFQATSWAEYLRDQANIRAALERRLRADAAGAIADPWQRFRVDTVVLAEQVPPLQPRDERRAVYARFIADAATVEQRLDEQEQLSTGDKRSAYDVLLHAHRDGDQVWIARFRDGELVTFSVEG